MVKITTMPKETLAELLFFIAENETFSRVTRQLGKSFTVQQVRAALREVAEGLAEEARLEGGTAEELHAFKTSDALSSQARSVIAALSAEEEQKLFSAFGIGRSESA